MMPKLQMSTLGPYSFRVTTSGAIQYGVPTIVVRFAPSEICAQKPKSAVETCQRLADTGKFDELTELDVSVHAQTDVVTLDITVNDPVSVKVLETLACLP